MANAKDARQWARHALHGIGDSLYTPFSGRDGDDIDWDAYRTLVRHCVGTLGHPMLWVTSGVAEFWSLTIAERKKLLEVAIDEARGINPDVIVQSCTAAIVGQGLPGADAACPGRRRRHRLHPDADDGTARRRRCFELLQYIADRTDIALGMFNSPSSGYVLSAQEGARIVEEIPAVCATKEGSFQAASEPHAARARAGSGDLGMRYDGVPGRLAQVGHRRPRPARHHGLPL